MEQLTTVMHIKTLYFVNNISVVEVKTKKVEFPIQQIMNHEIVHLLETREKHNFQFLWPACLLHKNLAAFFVSDLNSFIEGRGFENYKVREKKFHQIGSVHLGLEFDVFLDLADFQASVFEVSKREFICNYCLVKLLKSLNAF